jgi:hypothetical protein
MLAAGVAQGIAFLPYARGMGVPDVAQALRRAGAIPLDDAYRAAFGVSLDDRRVHRWSGEVRGRRRLAIEQGPEALVEVNHAFQRLLLAQGMSAETAAKYVLVAEATHIGTRGAVLLAVVLRHTRTEPVRVRTKAANHVRTLRADQPAWYEAYERDVDGQPIDEVMDWAGMDVAVLEPHQAIATLLVLGAEVVKFDRRAADYWQVERRWLAGDTAGVMQETAEKVRRALAS